MKFNTGEMESFSQVNSDTSAVFTQPFQDYGAESPDQQIGNLIPTGFLALFDTKLSCDDKLVGLGGQGPQFILPPLIHHATGQWALPGIRDHLRVILHGVSGSIVLPPF